MSGGQEGQGAGVDDAQALQAVDAGLAVEDGHGVVGGAHLARRRGVIDGDGAFLDPGQNVLVRGDVQARGGFDAVRQPLRRQIAPDFPLAAHALDRERNVRWVRQPVRVHDRMVHHRVAGDGDVAPRERRDEARVDRGVVVAVFRVFLLPVALSAQIGADGEPFQLGPVGGEVGGEGGEGRIRQVAPVRLRQVFPAVVAGAEDAEGSRRVDAEGLHGLGGEGEVVEGGRGRVDVDTIVGAEEDMVPHVLTHAREVFNDGDVVLLQGRFRTHARDHEQLRRLERARGDNDFFACGQGVVEGLNAIGTRRGHQHARGRRAVEEDLLRQTVLVHDRRRSVLQRRLQETRLGRGAIAVPGVDAESRVRGSDQTPRIEARGHVHADVREPLLRPGAKGVDEVAEGNLQRSARRVEGAGVLLVGGIRVEGGIIGGVVAGLFVIW